MHFDAESGVAMEADELTVQIFPLEDGQTFMEADLVRVRVQVPTTGKVARGPVLAVCPRGCGSRARVLWVDPEEEFFPVCRECAQIEYATARGTELERAELAYDRLRQRYGLSKHASHEPRPNQHLRSYRREAARLEKARVRVAAARSKAWAAVGLGCLAPL